MKQMRISTMLVAFAAGAVFSVFADTTYTPTDAGWGEALTVAEGETVIIDTLKTRGKLSVSGTTTVNSGGTLDIESGEAFFAFGSKTAKGIIYIRQGATLKMNMDEAIAGQDAELYIYGSLNSNGYRQRFDHMIFHMYDGSRIYGAGNATYAGLDFGCGGATTLYPADYGRLVIHGTVTIETSARVRSGGTFHLACCENSRVVFSDGFYGTSSEGTFIQVLRNLQRGYVHTGARDGGGRQSFRHVRQRGCGAGPVGEQRVLHVLLEGNCPPEGRDGFLHDHVNRIRGGVRHGPGDGPFAKHRVSGLARFNDFHGGRACEWQRRLHAERRARVPRHL